MLKEDIENLINSKIKFAEKKYGKELKNLIIEILALEKSIAPEPSVCGHSRLIEITKWNDFHPYPTNKAMRMMDYRRKENDFEKFNVTERFNGRVLVNEENYFRWYDAHKEAVAK